MTLVRATGAVVLNNQSECGDYTVRCDDGRRPISIRIAIFENCRRKSLCRGGRIPYGEEFSR